MFKDEIRISDSLPPADRILLVPYRAEPQRRSNAWRVICNDILR